MHIELKWQTRELQCLLSVQYACMTARMYGGNNSIQQKQFQFKNVTSSQLFNLDKYILNDSYGFFVSEKLLSWP